MPPGVVDTLRITYAVDVADKGTKQLLKSERQVRKDLVTTTRELARQDAAVKRSAGVVRQAASTKTAASRSATAAIRREQSEVTQLTRRNEQLVVALRKAEAAQKRLTTAQSKRPTATGKMAAGAVGGVGALAARGTRLAAGAGAGLGIASLVGSFVGFEKQMDKVQATAGATNAQMREMNALAKKLGADTAFSAKEAADGMYQLSTAGFTANETMKILPGTLDLASASGTELAAAAELQAAAIRGFGLSASDASHVADVLAKTVNSSAVEMADLGDTLPYVASTARQTGTSFEQVAAAAGILGNAGIKGSMAGTALRTSMLRLTDPTKKMSGVLATMGLEASDLAAKSLPEVIGSVAEGLKKLPTRGEKVGAISAIFGKEAAPAMLNLMSKGRGEIDKLVKSLEDSDGAAKKTAKTMRGNVAGAWDEFTGSIETAGITLLEKHGPAMQRTLKTMSRGVNDLAKELSSPEAAKFAKDIVEGLKPAGQAIVAVGKVLIAHPKLVLAAAGAYSAFRTARGVLKIARDVRDLGGAINTVRKRAAGTKIASMLAEGAVGAGRRVGRAMGSVTTVVADKMSEAAAAGAAQLRKPGRWRTAGRIAGRTFGTAFGVGVVAGVVLAANEATKKGYKAVGAKKGTATGFGQALFNTIFGGGNRKGGIVGRYQSGGLVPIAAAGGEMMVHGGAMSMIGGDPGRDGTMVMAPVGAAILTHDGQARMSMGASLTEAVRSQAPHFAKGGVVAGKYMSTAYGPPWGGIQGTGTTATGVNLSKGPKVYGIAVDPSMIALGSQVFAKPNPFSRSGPFRAFDTGGAIKGKRIDFYDWRGRKKQNAWGRRSVTISRGAGGPAPASDDEDVVAHVPLTPGASKTRAGLLDDAVAQGVAAGQEGLTRNEIARANAGRRGARVNPIMEAIRGALTPTTREVTIPGRQTSSSSSGGGADVGGAGLPSGVTTPDASWNPAGKPIAKWIVPYLSWAASAARTGSRGPARGNLGGRWTGVVSSGYRSNAEQTRIWNSGVRPAARPGTSNHEGSKYPRGAVDVTEAQQLATALRAKPGPKLLQFAGAKDPVHFSHPHGGSYRAGGVVGGKLGAALASARSFKGGSFAALDAAIGNAIGTRLDALRAQVIRAVRAGGSKKTIQRLQGVVDLIDFEIGRRIGRMQDVVEQRTARIDRTAGAADRALRLAGVDPGSTRGLGVMGAVQAGESKTRAANVRTLQNALKVAQRTGNRTVIREVQDRLKEAQDALAESLVKQVETWRDQIRALGQEAVDRAQFTLGLAGAGASLLEAGQRMAGTANTPGAMAARATFQATTVIPALQGQVAAAQFAAKMAAGIGDVNGFRAAVQDAMGATVDLANAQADAMELMRQAAEQAAQDVVDAASSRRSFADMAAERLDLEQQLVGTHDTAGGAVGRADFIRSTIIPAIQGEITALVAQQATAQATGNAELARQIGEAIYAKQNDVLREQVDALNEIKSNTDPLKEFGGSQAFSYQGQTFTDLDAIRARVGA